jgi:hypothetical protein
MQISSLSITLSLSISHSHTHMHKHTHLEGNSVHGRVCLIDELGYDSSAGRVRRVGLREVHENL